MKYAIVIEKSETGYGAYAPDLPGLGVVADSPAEARRLIAETIAFHIEGLKADGEPVSAPSVLIDYVETPAA